MAIQQTRPFVRHSFEMGKATLCFSLDPLCPVSKQSLHCSLVDTSLWTTPPEKVMLSTTLGPMTSSGLQTSRQSSIGTIIFLPPSMRRLSKPSGECWNHCQSAKKLEVKLTQSKIRYLPEGQSQLSGAITSTYKSLLVVDTSNMLGHR